MKKKALHKICLVLAGLVAGFPFLLPFPLNSAEIRDCGVGAFEPTSDIWPSITGCYNPEERFVKMNSAGNHIPDNSQLMINYKCALKYAGGSTAEATGAKTSVASYRTRHDADVLQCISGPVSDYIDDFDDFCRPFLNNQTGKVYTTHRFKWQGGHWVRDANNSLVYPTYQGWWLPLRTSWNLKEGPTNDVENYGEYGYGEAASKRVPKNWVFDKTDIYDINLSESDWNLVRDNITVYELKGMKQHYQECLKVYLEEWAHRGDCGEIVLDGAKAGYDESYCQWVNMHSDFPNSKLGLRSEFFDYENFNSRSWQPSGGKPDANATGPTDICRLDVLPGNQDRFFAKDGDGKNIGLDFSKRGCPTVHGPDNTDYFSSCVADVGANRLNRAVTDIVAWGGSASTVTASADINAVDPTTTQYFSKDWGLKTMSNKTSAGKNVPNIVDVTKGAFDWVDESWPARDCTWGSTGQHLHTQAELIGLPISQKHGRDYPTRPVHSSQKGDNLIPHCHFLNKTGTVDQGAPPIPTGKPYFTSQHVYYTKSITDSDRKWWKVKPYIWEKSRSSWTMKNAYEVICHDDVELNYADRGYESPDYNNQENYLQRGMRIKSTVKAVGRLQQTGGSLSDSIYDYSYAWSTEYPKYCSGRSCPTYVAMLRNFEYDMDPVRAGDYNWRKKTDPQADWCSFEVPFDPFKIISDKAVTDTAGIDADKATYEDKLHTNNYGGGGTEPYYGPSPTTGSVSITNHSDNKGFYYANADTPTTNMVMNLKMIERIRNGCGAFDHRSRTVRDPGRSLSEFMLGSGTVSIDGRISRCAGWRDVFNKTNVNPSIVEWRLPRFDYEFLKAFIECTGPIMDPPDAIQRSINSAKTGWAFVISEYTGKPGVCSPWPNWKCDCNSTGCSCTPNKPAPRLSTPLNNLPDFGFWCSCPTDDLMTNNCREDFCTCDQHIVTPGAEAEYEDLDGKSDTSGAEYWYNLTKTGTAPRAVCKDYGPFKRWLQCFYRARAKACPILTRDISNAIPSSLTLMKKPHKTIQAGEEFEPNAMTAGSATGTGVTDYTVGADKSWNRPWYTSPTIMWHNNPTCAYYRNDELVNLPVSGGVCDYSSIGFRSLTVPYPNGTMVGRLHGIANSSGNFNVNHSSSVNANRFTVTPGYTYRVIMPIYVEPKYCEDNYKVRLLIKKATNPWTEYVNILSPDFKAVTGTCAPNPQNYTFDHSFTLPSSITSAQVQVIFEGRTRPNKTIYGNIDYIAIHASPPGSAGREPYNGPPGDNLRWSAEEPNILARLPINADPGGKKGSLRKHYSLVFQSQARDDQPPYMEPMIPDPRENTNGPILERDAVFERDTAYMNTKYEDGLTAASTAWRSPTGRASEVIVGPRGCDIGGWYEMMLYQARCIKWFRLNCMCDYYKTFETGSAEAYVRKRGGAQFPTLEILPSGEFKKLPNGEYADIEYHNFPLVYRGDVGSSYPKSAAPASLIMGGLDYAKVGDFIIYDETITTGQDKYNNETLTSTPDGVPDNARYRRHVAFIEAGKYVPLKQVNYCTNAEITAGTCPSEMSVTCSNADITAGRCALVGWRVSEWNWGKNLDSCGNTDRWKARTERIIFKDARYASNPKVTTALVKWYCTDADYNVCYEENWDRVRVYRPSLDYRTCSAPLPAPIPDASLPHKYKGKVLYTESAVNTYIENNVGRCDPPFDPVKLPHEDKVEGETLTNLDSQEGIICKNGGSYSKKPIGDGSKEIIDSVTCPVADATEMDVTPPSVTTGKSPGAELRHISPGDSDMTKTCTGSSCIEPPSYCPTC